MSYHSDILSKNLMTRLSDNYNLQKLCSDLAKEWHPTKNGTLTPRDVTPNSGKKVWWLCSKNQNHEWDAIINSRISGSGCPYCAGQKVRIDNCLKTINPKLAKEWHPTKNGSLTPKDVTPNSQKKVWWVCSKGHKWEAVISSRNRGSGCPYCFKKRRKLRHRRFKV